MILCSTFLFTSLAAARPISVWVRMVPIVAFLVYLNFTVLLFAFGPVEWPV